MLPARQLPKIHYICGNIYFVLLRKRSSTKAPGLFDSFLLFKAQHVPHYCLSLNSYSVQNGSLCVGQHWFIGLK